MMNAIISVSFILTASGYFLDSSVVYHDQIEQWHTDRLDGLEQSQRFNSSQIESLTAQLERVW